MTSDVVRKAIWLAGAVLFTGSYGAALAASPIDIPQDVPHDLLLLASGMAACMVGGGGAVLLFDRLRGRR